MTTSTEKGKHTSGPWDADHCTGHETKNDPGYWQIDGPTPMGLNGTIPYTVADTLNRNYCIAPEEDEANARLIAAAPEMLEALEYFVNAAISSHPMEFVSIDRALKFAQLAEAAIQRAREGR